MDSDVHLVQSNVSMLLLNYRVTMTTHMSKMKSHKMKILVLLSPKKKYYSKKRL